MCDTTNMDIKDIKTVEIDHRKLALAREERGLSQSAVARQLGVNRQRIWQFEQGVSLTLENFTKLMLFYDKPIEFFIKAEAVSE